MPVPSALVPGIDATSSILVDQTTLCEASRLLGGAPSGTAWVSQLMSLAGYATSVSVDLASADWRITSAERLVNLALLLDAVALYERVLVVRGELPVDAESLSLRSVLLEQGVVEEIHPLAFSYTLAREIGGLVRVCTPRVSELSERQDTADEIEEALVRFAAPSAAIDIPDASTGSAPSQELCEALRICEEAAPVHWWMRGAEAKRDPLHEVGSHILDQCTKKSSGHLTAAASHLRTLVYWRLSDHLRVPFCPSTRRMPLLNALRAHAQHSVQDSVYKAVATAFQSDLSSVAEQDREVEIILPPSVALFLTDLRDTRDLSRSVKSLRDRFAPLRRQLAKIAARTAEGTLATRLGAKRELAAVLGAAAVSAATGGAEQATMARDMIDLVPDLLKVAAAPLDMTKYSAALLLKPAEWIRSWWVGRPLQIVFDVRHQLSEVASLAVLLREATGIELTREDVSTFQKGYARSAKAFLG